MTRALRCAATALLLAVAARAAGPPAGEARLLQGSDRVDALLADWAVEEAAKTVAAMLAEQPDDARALLLAARVAFYEADYPKATALAKRASEAEPRGVAKDAADMLAWLSEREPLWSTFTEHRQGMFVVRTTPRDEILVPYAFEALAGAAKAMKEEFGFEPTSPVVVEMYPTRRAFIAASTLTREEVETSGTLAICHFHRIMMLSPGVLARGYDWMDALCHEYVHYTVYSVGGGSIPVWLHEGIAKHLETRWRSPDPLPLDPHSTSVLAEGIETGRWVTFEQMHPSMAKLPSGELVSLAFAEVATTAGMLRAEQGGDALRALVLKVRDERGDVDEALTKLWGFGFSGMEARALAHAKSLPLLRIPGLVVFGREAEGGKPKAFDFADEGEKPDDPEAQARRIADRQAQDWVLLADRLKGRRMLQAALIEYDKALARLGQSEPMVANKKAHALLLMSRPRDAVAVLEQSLKYAPDMAATLDNLAEARLALAAASKDESSADADRRAALELARRSERINPFSMDTHVRLASLYERFGRPDDAARSRERIALLRQGR